MELEHDPSSLPLLHFWSHAKYLNEGTEGSEELDDEAPPLDQIKIESYRHDGYTLYVVNIPMPEISPHAYKVAIAVSDDSLEYMSPMVQLDSSLWNTLGKVIFRFSVTGHVQNPGIMGQQ